MHVRKAVLIVGTERLGPPPEDIRTRLESVTDLERLDRMLRIALRAANWDEVLETQ
jgi:hypothetical protein